MRIGKKLKAIRKERKMTLKELEEKSGVQIATLSRMEHDIMTGTLHSHINICKALGVSLSDFYRDVEDEHKTVSLIKKRQKHPSFVYPKKSMIEMLTTQVTDKKMMPLLIKIRKGGQTHN
ncbi:MAG: helix-turn-helix transcriptional regulator, partial [Candidatus Omnitrophota bacterium]